MELENNSENKDENDTGKNDSNYQALILFEDKKETNLDDKNEENKVYNDVNYWHAAISDDINEDILKELE